MKMKIDGLLKSLEELGICNREITRITGISEDSIRNKYVKRCEAETLLKIHCCAIFFKNHFEKKVFIKESENGKNGNCR